ncbi:hypothetical protein [Aeromonas allosaccharophila]|uniref:hypothetical protein n=1 Tax=Aeromonas allosaccharophila TaxID=656 RepID=UPI003006CA65
MSKKKRYTEEFKLAAVSLELDLYFPPSQGLGKPDSELELASKSRRLYGLHLCGSNVDSEEKEKGHYL